MFTNTYLPHVGGVARSVHSFIEALRNKGHRARVVAPCFNGTPLKEPDVFRIPAIRNFNGSGFSTPLFAPGTVSEAVEDFRPDIIHSHHPFLLGNTALRYASFFRIPIVFTHHTLYERYTHYIPGDSLLLRRFVVSLAVRYCNACDAVVAPSTSLASMITDRGVRTPIKVIPTGVNRQCFSQQEAALLKKRLAIPSDAFVIGHVGRLAKEKNLEFLALALSRYLRANRDDHVIIAGAGPMEEYVRELFAHHGLNKRLHMLGILDGVELPFVYRAMDVFAFSSQSETQGLVITEAFASGVPVVALDGPGVRDVVKDGINGRLIRGSDLGAFITALEWMKSLGEDGKKKIEAAVFDTAAEFDMGRSAEKLLSLYGSLVNHSSKTASQATSYRNMLATHGRIMGNTLTSVVQAVTPISREIYSCSDNLPQDTEIQTLLARHSGIGACITGYFISIYIRMQKVSWHKHQEGLEYLKKQLQKEEPVLVSFWHGKYLPLFALLEGLHGCIFASCSFRGEVVAEICRRFGYECILIPEHARTRAVDIMARSILHYGVGAVAADGPRGPYRVFKRGSVQLSSELGMTVIPMSVATFPKIVSRRRWDRYEAPLPFGHVYLMIGSGIPVPVGLKSHEIDSWSRKLKAALDDVDEKAEEGLRSKVLQTKRITHGKKLLRDIGRSKERFREGYP